MLTLFYAGALTLLGIVLATITGRQRLKTKISLGLGEDLGMLKITRAHGNLIENAVFFLILSALLELLVKIPSIATAIMGDIFVLSRIAHAYGITRPDATSVFRSVGIGGTILVLLTQSIWAMYASLEWLINNNWGL
tara:strand:+ start:21957 stop:22367 length:411 start_codon:yes stop_codon:yes gene_type:complete